MNRTPKLRVKTEISLRNWENLRSWIWQRLLNYDTNYQKQLIKKRCSMLLIIRWKSKLKIDHPTVVRMAIRKFINNAQEGTEKKKTSCTVCGDINWCSQYWAQYGGFLNTKDGVAIWSSNPLLGTYPEKTKTRIWKDTCTPVFTAALLNSSQHIKEAYKCPSKDTWEEKMWHIYYTQREK